MRQMWKTIVAVLLLVVVLIIAVCMDRMPEKHTVSPVTQAAIREEMMQKEPVSTATTAPVETAESEVPAETAAPTESQEKTFRLSFVGDCTFGAIPSNYYAGVGFIKTIGEDYAYPFRNVISYFEQDDASFINLEGPLTDKGNPAANTNVFRGPEAFIDILTTNSIEFAGLANNHINDYGKTGYDSTVSLLNNANIPYVERDASAVFTLDGGLKVGVYGTTYFGLNQKDMQQEIQSMKDQGAQLIIVAAHWGLEGNYKPIADQTKFGHAAIDAGAHIVWGSHPNVLQPIEEYNGGIIYYSLGNFSYGGNGAPRDMDSAILQQEVVQKDAYLRDYPLNEGTLVMIVERNHKYIVPNGKLLLKKGDKLLLISAKNDETDESKKTHNMLEMISIKRSKQR